MPPHFFQDTGAIPIVEIVCPSTQSDIDVSDNPIQWKYCAIPCRQLCDAFFDFCKRFWRWANIRISIPGTPTRANLHFKAQEVEAFLPCIDYVGLGLIQREIKTIQNILYPRQRRIYLAFAQHDDVVRVADDACSQLPVQLMLVPDAI